MEPSLLETFLVIQNYPCSYYGAGASYVGKHVEIFGGAERRKSAGNDGEAFWNIYEDNWSHGSGEKKTIQGVSGNEGGAYWDIYSDSPSYSGPSYRDLRKRSKPKNHPKSYQMRRSAPIDSPYDMVADHKKNNENISHVREPSINVTEDLQCSRVQESVRPHHGLGFSRWDGQQQSDEKPVFLGEDPSRHGY